MGLESSGSELLHPKGPSQARLSNTKVFDR
jgi:hypothetical protein